MLLLPLGVYCAYGARHMILLSHVRGLAGGDIRELQFTSFEKQDETIAVSKPTVVERIAQSLGDTTPYSPHHEGISHPWRLNVNLNDGSSITLHLGRGNRSNPETVWVQFGVEVYQNPSLRRVLAEEHLGLSNGKAGAEQ